jgi:hypothetical protein
MKKRISMILLVLIVAGVFIVGNVFAAPTGLSSDGKSGKTPGAQATLQAEKWVTNHPEKTKGPQNAQASQGKKYNFRGTVASMTDTLLMVTLKDGSIVSVTITLDTAINFPGMKSQNGEVTATPLPTATASATETPTATPGVIPVGSQVIVHAFKETDGTYTALSIMFIPGKPELIHRVGVVTAYVPGVSIEITTTTGEVTLFLLTAETKYLPIELFSTLGIGSTVTIISPRDTMGGPATAMGVVIHTAETTTETPTVVPTP